MEWTPEIDELVEKYFADHLTGEEWKEWEAMMKVPQFRSHVKNLAEQKGKLELKTEIETKARIDKWQKSRFSRRWFRLMLIVIAIWLALILYFLFAS